MPLMLFKGFITRFPSADHSSTKSALNSVPVHEVKETGLRQILGIHESYRPVPDAIRIKPLLA
jgi:hypothetical protein